MSDFLIKWGLEEDLGLVNEVNKYFENNEYSHTEEFFRQGIDGGRLMVACNDGQPAGSLVYQLLWGNTPFLALLRVVPKFREKGLGRKMIRLLEEELRKKGYRNLISSSEASNEGGQSFHEKLGFLPIGELEMIFGREVFYRKTF